MVFLPTDAARAATSARSCSSRSSARKGRPSSAGATCRPTTRCIGPTARVGEPVMRQVFIGRGEPSWRRRRWPSSASSTSSASASRTRSASPDSRSSDMFYVPSLSCRTLVYKGMLTPTRSTPYFPDLADPAMRVGPGPGPLALQHQHLPHLGARASLPLLAHNGEINTLRGNVNWMHARESMLAARRCSATTSRRSCPIIDAERQRLGHVRQRARTARARRAARCRTR